MAWADEEFTINNINLSDIYPKITNSSKQKRLKNRGKPKGRQVRKTIENFYTKKKGISKSKARYIAGAIARKEHRGY